MLLTLRYQEMAQRTACAAFLCGTDAAVWLREIGRWGLSAGQLSCYLVPESIRSVRPAGLFVVVKDGSPLPADLLEPYGVVAGGLYVPVQATLWPATTPDELAGALLWPRQLLHPSIGLIGFETADEIDLTALLDCVAPRSTDWGLARPGLAPKPRLERVRVLAPTVAEVVESFQQEIGTVPLTALPGASEAHPGMLQRALDSLRRGMLTFFLALVRWLPTPALGQVGRAIGVVLLLVLGIALLIGLMGKMGSGSAGGLLVPLIILLVRLLISLTDNAGNAPHRPPAMHRPASSRPGVFQRLENWLGGRIHHLEQKRQNEIERLLRLFGDNTEEALKYAIPLNSPYMNRGQAPPSAWLGQRLADFNLGGLGGGGRVDVWDLGAYRHNLGLQYRAAATREMEAGRFKKAAYIYAHLLGDYQAAANALDQGGFYREAAALFKDHLHNLPAAAKCLENGGLLLEAAELYAELKEHEKAGDLHQRLEQPMLAARHYERGVSLFLDNDDRPAAARLLADKLAAPDRAQQVLLQGWASSKQPELCLKQYFDVLAAASEADLRPHVQDIYRNHTAAWRRVPLLHVLSTVNEKHATPELRAATLEIAYEVVSAEAEAGNASPLALLRNFLPDDRLLAADCSRYATRQPRPVAASSVSDPLVGMQLDATIEWISAVTHGHQWVAIGMRDDRLHLARGNWYGQVEYYSWLADMNGVYVLLIADEQHGNRILLRTSAVVGLETKYLPKNKHFPIALTVECPTWLPPWPVRVTLMPGGVTAAAWREDTTITVQRYLAGGQLLTPFTTQLSAPIRAEEEGWPAELLYRDGEYYSYWGNKLVKWADSGWSRVYTIEEGSNGFYMTSSAYSPKLQLAIFTPFNLLLWEPQKRISNEPLPVFSPNFTAIGDMKFVSAQHLVLLNDSRAALLQKQENRYVEVRNIELKNEPVAVLPTINRQQFALLEMTGRISLHHIDNS
ncbi:hypothetical protein LRS06_24870 [Hymenobacter sp. J193]|uniref:hypothetical protein n=1 Tax=Hymenobacter sp. J193 TaxID=2898429 RepID=UPI002151EDC2|nr:hypothetical protein [Hymenobacter sp. J193]MCR5890960.1 hypothetical protein [Hymenobacter sp. J193]